MIFNDLMKRKVKRQRFAHKWCRELSDAVLTLEADRYVDGETILDIIEEQYKNGQDVADICLELSNLVGADGIKTTAVVVSDAGWRIILSQNPNYELEF